MFVAVISSWSVCGRVAIFDRKAQTSTLIAAVDPMAWQALFAAPFSAQVTVESFCMRQKGPTTAPRINDGLVDRQRRRQSVDLH